MAAVRNKTDLKFILLCLMAGGSLFWMWETFFNISSRSTLTDQTSRIATARPQNVTPLTQAEHVANGDTAPFQLIEMVKSTVGASLRDPDTAQYSQVSAYTSAKETGKIHFCGVVNARNGFGGYNGPRRFIAIPAVKVWFQGIVGFTKTYRDFCRPAYLIKEVPIV